MDEDLKRYLDGMEARQVERLNNGVERVLDRLTKIEVGLRDLDTKHDGTRAMVIALPATVLKAIEEPMLRRLRDIEERVTRLEKKDGGVGPGE
jgi:hypothetical protein